MRRRSTRPVSSGAAERTPSSTRSTRIASRGRRPAAFEIVEELGGAPDVLALPYGGGGNTRAYALGFEEADSGLPPILAGEASERAFTMATAIRIAAPAHRPEADEAVARSGGSIVPLADGEILAAWQDLARLEAVFCEPSSAAGLAALIRERPEPGARVVCVITGHGLKDPEAAARLSSPPIQVPPDPDAIAEAAA